VVVALLLAACSRSPASSGPPPATPVAAVSSFAVCFGAMPADWSQRLQARDLTADFQLSAVSGDGRLAYGEVRSTAGAAIAAVDLGTGTLSTITGLPQGAAGVGAMAETQPWLVWEELDSATDLGDWSVRAWNEQSNTVLDLATSRLAGGEEVFGQAPLPVVADGVVAWAQPLPRTGSYPEAQVLRYDLGTRRTAVLDSGRVSGPVFAGSDLVWARVDTDGSYALRAVDAATGRPATLPGLASSPGPVRYLAGSSRYLAWSTDQQSLHVWRIGRDEYSDYTTDLEHPLQFLQIAGDFVLWYAGYPSSVLDLRTGRAFDLRGAVAGSDAVIAESEPSRATSTKGDLVPARLSYVPLSGTMRIDGC
jgi:hypothetical protein